ncbi:MAG: lipopolysaccharide biosynthesis protein [Bradyrhizobium sp.]|nr:MAG: lipopolysaccharide biosynthesis protein [Bradyrhizobium sp.]
MGGEGFENVGAETRGDAVDLAWLARAMLRRRGWIIWPTIGCALAALAFVMLASPRYTGVAKVLLENQESYFTRPDKATAEPSASLDPEGVQSQAETVTTTELARKAVDRLALAQRVEFNPPDTGNPLSIIWSLIGRRAGNPQDRLLDNFLAHLTVFPIAKSRVLQIEFSSSDPALAAHGANMVAALYLESQQQAKQDEAKSAAAWLSGKIDELRGKVAEAESKSEAFRTRSGLLAGANGMTVPTQQLSDMTTQLASARAAHASALATAQSLRELVRDGRLDEIPQVSKDESLRRYVEQRVALKAQIAQESRTLLPEHPRMKELAGELAGLDAEIKLAAATTVTGLESDAKLAEADVDNLTAALARQSTTVASGNVEDVQLRALELDAKTARDQLESYLQKYREAVAREADNAAPADARIIADASEPREPTFPKKGPTILLATLAGLIVAASAVAAHALLTEEGAGAERRPRAATGESQRVDPPLMAEAITSPPVETPAPTPPPEAVAPAPAPEPVAAPREPQAPSDAILSVAEFADRMAATASGPNGAPLALIAGDASGRAAGLALAVGRRLAARGRAALVDLGDTPGRADEIVTEEGEAPAAGLAELLDGRANFGEALHRDRDSRLDVIPAGSGPIDVSMLGSALAALAANYDFVVMHAYDWRSPAACAVRESVAALAIAAPSTRLPASLAQARDALAGQAFEVVGPTSQSAASAVEVA